MDKVIESPTIPTIQAETETTLSSTSTFGEEFEGGVDTVEGPKGDSDYETNNYIEYDEQLDEFDKSESDRELHHNDDEEELRDLSYFTSDVDEESFESFSKNLKTFRIDEELDLKALDNSKSNIDPTSKFDIT